MHVSTTLSAALAVILAAGGCQRPAEPVSPAASSPERRDAGEVLVLSSRPESRSFRDWRVACDNGAECVAFSPATPEGAGWLRLALSPDPAAQPEVVVGLSERDAPAGPASPLRLIIDGRAFRLEPEPEAGRIQARVPGPDAVAVARALGGGRRAVLTHGAVETPLSLTGAAAALLWIDERQGRLDTPDALMRVGDETPRARPPALPQITAAPAAAQTGFGAGPAVLPASIEALPTVQSCRAETAFNPDVQMAVVGARLGEGRELWTVPCFVGAYNVGVRAFVTGAGGTNPVPVFFPTASGEALETVVNAAYDPAAQTLSAFNKGRGIGDCGVAQTWTWTGQAFVLTEQSEMKDCWGAPPELWPSLWRSR